VLSVTGVGVADVNLSKDIVELLFNGNTFGQEIELTGSYSDAVAYVQTGLSYGRQIANIGQRRLAVGATVKYLRGLAVEELTELEGSLNTLETGFTGDGRMVARTATGGSGFALDLGGTLEFSRNYTVGLCIRNFLSNISWSNDTEEHGYLFSFDTMTVDNMEDDYVVSEDYTEDIAGFSTKLPATMTIGVANVTGDLLWAVDWQQGFRVGAGSTTKPRLAAGLEWNKFSLLPLRTGFATGGNKGSTFSFGSGLRLAGFRLDVAAQTGSSLSPYSTRGLNFALARAGLRPGVFPGIKKNKYLRHRETRRYAWSWRSHSLTDLAQEIAALPTTRVSSVARNDRDAASSTTCRSSEP
jgi:hypothetical protein